MYRWGCTVMNTPVMKMQALILVKLCSEEYRDSEVITHSTPYMNGGATMRGVFKAYAFFFNNSFDPFL